MHYCYWVRLDKRTMFRVVSAIKTNQWQEEAEEKKNCEINDHVRINILAPFKGCAVLLSFDPVQIVSAQLARIARDETEFGEFIVSFNVRRPILWWYSWPLSLTLSTLAINERTNALLSMAMIHFMDQQRSLPSNCDNTIHILLFICDLLQSAHHCIANRY